MPANADVHAAESLPGSRTAGDRPPAKRLGTWLAAGLIWLVFAVPLFVGLDRWDLRNDEAIYAFAVDKMLETGDWLTPLGIPTEEPFLEKPPLKFWLVAGAMAAGLTPTNEIGMRIFDALFGAIAFGYVLAFGWRLGGLLAGAVALLVLWTFDPFIFQALRGNHMEAALIVGYAGGLWHLLRWREIEAAGRRRLHAFSFAGYFVLGFMTKFVAACFLPMIAVAWLLFDRGGVARRLATWRDWVWPAVASLVAILPWFVYQSFEHGGLFWQTILGRHVIARLTGVLHPEHLQPWHFYFTQTWRGLAHGESLALVVAGFAVLVWQTWRGSVVARLLLLWWLLPVAIISMGTSKLIFYALPFVTPLALGAGWATSLVFHTLFDWTTTLLRGTRLRLRSIAPYVDARPRLRQTLLIVGAICFGLAVWTFVTGVPFTVMAGDVRVFRSSSVSRVIVIGAVALLVAGWVRAVSAWLTGMVLVLILLAPFHIFRSQAQRTLRIDHPLRAARDCMLVEQQAGRAPTTGMYIASPSVVSHSPFYYLHALGEWRWGPDGGQEQTTQTLFATSTPVIISEAQWNDLRPGLGGALDTHGDSLPRGIRAVRVEQEALLLLPGAYAVCEEQILAGGGRSYARGASDQ